LHRDRDISRRPNSSDSIRRRIMKSRTAAFCR